MGRKKKKQSKPWCWYCNREFEDEKILIQHQKAKHFKCHICGKKLFTGPGLAIHCMQVHKETIDKIPAAVPGRDSVEIEVYGMEGIPPEDSYGEPREKQSKPVATSSIPTPSIPQMPPFGMMPYGMVPMPPMPYAMPMYQQMQMPMNVPMPSAAMPPVPAQAIHLPVQTAAPVSSHQGPPQQQPAMFPAYQNKSNPLEIAKSIASKITDVPSTSSAVKSLSSRTRIVCPDESVSLEERMATRYKNLNHRNVHYLSR